MVTLLSLVVCAIVNHQNILNNVTLATKVHLGKYNRTINGAFMIWISAIVHQKNRVDDISGWEEMSNEYALEKRAKYKNEKNLASL